MTEREWLDKAEEYERKAREAYEDGDETASSYFERKAEACRHNACYGTVEDA